MRRRFGLFVLVLTALVAAAGVAGAIWLRARLHASLPALDGSLRLPGLTDTVTVTRDSLGVPAIHGRTREDVARATGFLHGQDRFFQMDLSRRRAAGELAALVGARALAADQEIRLHRFRGIARQAVSLLADRDRRILDAYVDGVNAGLGQLGAPPFEYLLLRQAPQRWQAEDTLLVVLAMFITLQDENGSYESTLATMRDVLPPEMVDFLSPRGTEWDAAVDGSAFAMPPIPEPDVYDLRARRTGRGPVALPPPRIEMTRNWMPDDASGDAAVGSNNFAVSAAMTNGHGALVANDMHLTVRVPNTWYRAALEWREDGVERRVVGVTLPGAPAMVVGSNTRVAWGFTNTYADFGDIVLLEIDPLDATRYRTPDGWRVFEQHDEVIQVAGGADEHVPVTWTIWGPVLAPDHAGRARAYRWVAHSAERLASTVTPGEAATTIDEAFDEASTLGTPGQNMVAADDTGRIGWIIFGSLPRRRGGIGRFPESWADGTRGWDGWLQPGEVPRIVDPASGRLWTANARVAGGDMLAALGDNSYEIGSRASIIRDRLLAKPQLTAQDLLAIQLDVSASFLARWRELVLRTLTSDAVAGHPARQEFRRAVENTWTGTASPDSAAYRLTRMFREQASDAVVAFLLSECYDADPAFDYTFERRREGPIWAVLTQQPRHLLDPRYATWDELILASIDRTIALVRESDSGALDARRWSEYNVTSYRHPLSGALPPLGKWLDMPAQALAGDLYTPNMHWGANAPSERMIVSPGKESEGMLHMPTGQSGHPLSPFYANSHPAWVAGTWTPLLPGPTVHTLTLEP